MRKLEPKFGSTVATPQDIDSLFERVTDEDIAQDAGDLLKDALVQEKLAYAFPGREIVALKIDAISAGGGGVHCLTQSMPLVKQREGE